MKSAANESKLLKKQWMRTVPELVPLCRIDRKHPRYRAANERGKPLIPQVILVFKMVPGGGIEPPWNCFRRILSFPRILYVYDK